MVVNTWSLWKFFPDWKVNEQSLLRDIVDQDEFSWVIKVIQKKYRDIAASILWVKFSSLQSTWISEIWWVIDKVVVDMRIGLSNSKGKDKNWEIKNIFWLKYRMFLSWMLERLQNRWYTFSVDDVKDVPNEYWEWIYNILQDRWLTTFFMVGKAFWLLDFSDNIINKFPQEKEIKVLETSYDEVKSWLESWGDWVKSTEKFATQVEDIYYDDKNLRLDRQSVFWTKRSFRIRKKTYDNGKVESFYTIKRKKPEKKWKLEIWDIDDMKKNRLEPRDCFEHEFQILNQDVFTWFLEDIWLRESRKKSKRRRKFEITFEYRSKITHAVLDIDDYQNGIPEFLEIECDNKQAIPYIFKKLWLEDKVLLTCGSRWILIIIRKNELFKKSMKKVILSMNKREK